MSRLLKTSRILLPALPVWAASRTAKIKRRLASHIRKHMLEQKVEGEANATYAGTTIVLLGESVGSA
jgi:hypothetical protein